MSDVFSKKDIIEELEIEGGRVDFTVRKNELDAWILNVLDNLPAGVELITHSGDVKINEREKSYEIRIDGKRVYFPKGLYNRNTILEILRSGRFSDLLVREDKPFFEGFVFVFREREKEVENDGL